MSETDEVVIYTDGACKGNPGPGGWGALLVYKGVEKELWGGDPSTTNNRMELMAAIAGLIALTRPCAVKLVTDSQYVMKGIQEWMPNWKKRGWKTASKEPVKNADLWQKLDEAGLGTANLDTVGDIIACPGLDYCALANARSIPISQRISERFANLDRQFDVGPLEIKISGCINACGHHHVGHIGILGVDRKGEEAYQLTLGGRADEHAAIGKIIGPAFDADGIVEAVETVVETYLDLRQGPEERFLDALHRLGPAPFKARLYPERQHAA